MKKIILGAFPAFLIMGSLFYLVQNKKDDTKSAIRATKKAIKAEAVRMEEENIANQLNSDVHRISSLVDRSIEADATSITNIVDRIRKIREELKTLNIDQKRHEYRLARLQKIQKIVKHLEKAESTDQPIAEEPKENLSSKKFATINDYFGKSVAKIEKEPLGKTLYIDAQSLLIYDNRRLRVGTLNSKLFHQVIRDFNEKHGVSEVTIRAPSTMTNQDLLVVRDYLKRRYQWDPIIVRTPPNVQTKFSIELGILEAKGNEIGKFLNPSSSKL